MAALTDFMGAGEEGGKGRGLPWRAILAAEEGKLPWWMPPVRAAPRIYGFTTVPAAVPPYRHTGLQPYFDCHG